MGNGNVGSMPLHAIQVAGAVTSIRRRTKVLVCQAQIRFVGSFVTVARFDFDLVALGSGGVDYPATFDHPFVTHKACIAPSPIEIFEPGRTQMYALE